MNITYKKILFNDLSIKLVSYLLENEIYETTYQKSLLKQLYIDYIEENKKFDCVIAYINNLPIGIATIQELDFTLQPHLLTNSFNNSHKIDSLLDKKFKIYGSIQLFVLPEFRNKGIASFMCKELESLKIKKINFSNDEIPMIVASGNAINIAEKNLKYSYIIQSVDNYYNLPKDLHWQTYKFINRVLDNQENFFLSKEHMNYSIHKPSILSFKK